MIGPIGLHKQLAGMLILVAVMTVTEPAPGSVSSQYSGSCSDCHGMPPPDTSYRNITTGGFQGNHGTHAGSDRNTCARCHAGSDVYPYAHMNRRIDLSDNLNASPAGRYHSGGVPVSFKNRTSFPVFGTCSAVNCHFESITPVWGSAPYSSTADCSSCHSVPGPSVPHTKHNSYYSWAANGCSNCHPDYAAGPSFGHATSAASRGIRVTLAEGSYSGSGANWLPSQSGARTVGNCSNVYCHSNGQTPPTYVVQPWSGTLGCTGCHGDAPAGTLSGAHSRHVDNPVLGTNFSCADCHAPSVTGSTGIHDRSRHVNRMVDYSGVRAGHNPACSSFYCHSDGNGTYVDPPAWTSGASIDCNGCHSSQLRGDGAIRSGKHGRHLDNYTTLGRDNDITCRECHASTLSGPGTINNRGNHVNGLKNYSGVMAGSIPVAGFGTCGNAYCHSSGSKNNQYWNMTSASWYSSRTLSCNGCHGGERTPDGSFAAFTSVAGEPAYPNGGAGAVNANSHKAHAARSIVDSTGCARCHASTVDADMAAKLRDYSSAHLNRQRDVVFSPAIQGRYSATTQQCLNVYCHSTVPRFDNTTTQYGTPRWGDSTSCSTCHADPETADRLSGRHGKHTASLMYLSSCDRCHSGTVDSSGKIIDRSMHANSSKDVSFSNGGSYNSTTKDCTTYCHSDARGGDPTTAVKWSDKDKSMECYSCHKGRTEDSTEANCTASLGIWSSARTNCTPDLTMTSDGHHRLVGPQWIRKYPCYYCHEATMNADGSIKDRAMHVNGEKNVKIAAKWEISGREEKPTYIGKVCDNVYCHSDGTVEPDDVRPFPWDAPKTHCYSCHGHPTGSCNSTNCHDNKVHADDPSGKIWSLPPKFGNQTAYTWPAGEEWMGSLPMFPNKGAGHARANSHPRHAQTNFTCDICHAKTIKGDCSSCHADGIPPGGMGEQAHINGNFHVNKIKDVHFRNMSTAYYDQATKTCYGTTCHTGGVDPVWGGSVGSPAATCLACHGTTGTDVDDYNAFNGTQGKINLTQWETTGHGRMSSATNSGKYRYSNNPAANFPGNPCWYCHDNSVLHSDPANPYRLKMHRQYERRFEKECVYCHMERTDEECRNCHVGQSESLSPQATTGGIVYRFLNGTTFSSYTKFTDHKDISNCTTTGCHDSDNGRFANTSSHKGHETNAGTWNKDQKADVKNQYMMMGVCLQCHDDDSGNQCNSCHIAPANDPLRYSLGYNPGYAGYSTIKPRKARASAGHFGYKHYRAFTNSGGWQKRYTSVKSPIFGRYSTFSGTWKGGKFCWDCHDPHGDGNLYMIQSKVATSTDGIFGMPKTRADVTFTEDTGPYYVKKEAAFDGICNVCHSSSSKHFTWESGDGHNMSKRCTICHEHRFADSHANRQSCNSCHESSKPIPKHSAFGLPRDCTKCHLGTVGKRMDVMGQMKSNSHHVQGVEVNNKHCYECHWEATSLGLINNDYHTGYNYKTYTSVRNAEVDLVLYGPNHRPATFREMSSADGRATAVKFFASKVGTTDERAEVGKITNHCVSCHSDQNNDSMPFGDCKTPRQYAWDMQSIDARYSQKQTYAWGKYNSTTLTTVNQKDKVTKALSAHGNAVNNGGGWNATTGLDTAITNTRGGANNRNVECFDCHNSHGSKVVGVTTSYATFNGTYNGGNLKETKKDIGGYAADYKASSNSSGINPYGAGAGQCFDCHNSPSTGTIVPTGKTPWGYNSTFGADAPIMGYKDTPRFGEGTKASTARFSERDSRKEIVGGHLKASQPPGALPNLAKETGTASGGSTTTLSDSGKSWTVDKWKNLYVLMGSGDNSGQIRKIVSNTATVLTIEPFAAAIQAGQSYRIVPYAAPVNGLCTPCHDPHGVSPTLGADQRHGLPLLKGTWLTSPYKEDIPPPNPYGTEATDKSWAKYTYTHKFGLYREAGNVQPIVRYALDRNTFGTTNGQANGEPKRLDENDVRFAGLCLNCHKKETLTDGVVKNNGAAGFRTVDRIHESVKGWGANTEHSFSCSKCHQPHNSGLPRLMQTNCLDYKHRGAVPSGGVAWGIDKQRYGGSYGSYAYGSSGNEHRGYPIGSVMGIRDATGNKAPEATTACHVGRFAPSYSPNPATQTNWPDGNYWNDVTRW